MHFDDGWWYLLIIDRLIIVAKNYWFFGRKLAASNTVLYMSKINIIEMSGVWAWKLRSLPNFRRLIIIDDDWYLNCCIFTKFLQIVHIINIHIFGILTCQILTVFFGFMSKYAILVHKSFIKVYYASHFLSCFSSE